MGMTIRTLILAGFFCLATNAQADDLWELAQSKMQETPSETRQPSTSLDSSAKYQTTQSSQELANTTSLITELSNVDAATEKPKKWTAKAQEVIVNALSMMGVPYRYGGTSPESGFDCSGFVNYVYKHAVSLSLPRTASALSQVGHVIEKTELRPGDLVFFNTLRRSFSHVGIYIGDNKFIHAPSSGKSVTVMNMDNQYWADRYEGARRLDMN